ncbi:unnamed protein product [Brassicogethes aeneus]|uniref:Multidrug resistance-associated protein lethal(2)03659 n=1 Tax=Brassicogethes aeneus TaxID=1431903 RepID=A0A9P0B735_BRAAE|nr:unnamed protein product [Brassicogethes aeneus]
MDIDYEIKRQSLGKSFFSQCLLLWVLPFYKKSLKGVIELTDIYSSPNEMSSKYLGDKLEMIWLKHLELSKRKNQKPSLYKVLAKLFIWEYFLYAFYVFLEVVIFRCLSAIILSRFIEFFNDELVDDNYHKYLTATIYWILILLSVVFCVLSRYRLDCLGLKASIALSSLLYRKMIKLNQRSVGKTSSGQIVNILSNDLNRVEFFLRFSYNVVLAPVHLIVVTYLSWEEVGVSSFAGILFIVLIALPIQAFIGTTAAKFRSNVAIRSDKRSKLINEIVSGIKVIKMYTWEKPFEMLVRAVRCEELKYVYRSFLFCGLPHHIHALIHKFSVFLILLCCYLISFNTTTANTFAILQYMNLLRYSVLLLFPQAILSIGECRIAVKRIEDFLSQEEITDFIKKQTVNTEVSLSNIHALWSPNSIVLKIPKFHIPSGKFCTIAGPVGSGKSSLLQILLGELKPISGTVQINKSVSYCSQEPWLFCSSVKNNILFGQEYKEEKYREIVNICNLNKDFDIFPHGDQTLVGEKGVILSGGQKGRINLARALYKEAQVYLLDDPLSAVDTHVGRHLFDECLLKYLKGKTRILITHQLQYSRDADIVYVMNNGRIEASGSFKEVSKGHLEFRRCLSKIDEENDDGDQKMKKINTERNNLSNEKCIIVKDQEIIPKDINSFIGYITAGGNTLFILILILITLLAQISYNLADFWLVLWRKSKNYNTNIEIVNLNQTNENVPLYKLENTLTKYGSNFSTYAWIMLGAVVLTILRINVSSRFIWKASYTLHEKMFHSLLKAPMRFFNYHPSGRILNRFSKDIGTTDQLLPTAFLESSQLLLFSIGALILICLTSYYVIIFAVIFFVSMGLLFLANLKITMQVKHLEGITKSPIFTHINYSLTGLTTIRANKSEEKLIEQFDIHQDTHTSVSHLLLACTHAYTIWIDCLCVFLNIALPYAFILINQYVYHVDDSNVGLALSQAISFNGLLPFGLKRCTEGCTYFASVARILSYTKLEKEPLENSKDVSLAKTWPCYGGIKFRNVYLKYSENDDAVLKNLNFFISPNQKIGVVGRTGAGKSSLITALFRLADVEGTITIDNVNISEIGLTNLRRKISIIPQEPVLFSETVRYNLDPFQEFTDDEIWGVIEEVNMKGAVVSLDDMVLEGGSNFSIGQKQLLCLARALLRKNKILVLDEATANVDLRTDELIQKTIKTKFNSCTVLTIAHRLNTVMDSDKVMVMDGGELVEFAHPHILLDNDKGMFYSLVSETGVSMMQQLKQIAYHDYHSKVEVYKF